MLKALFSNRLFIGALAFFILTVGGSLLYMQHVERQTASELAAHAKRIKQLTEKQKLAPQAPIGDTSQGGHWHGDEWHAQPHEDPAVQPPAPNGNSDVVTETLPLSFPELPSTALPPEDQAIIDALRAQDALVRPEYHADEKAIRDAYKELDADLEKIRNDMLSGNVDWVEIDAAEEKLKEKHRRARALINDFRAKYAPSSQTEP